MKILRNLLIILISLFFLIVAIPTAYLYYQIPRHDIRTLKNGYVLKVPRDKKVSYQIVTKRPRGWIDVKKVPSNVMHAIVVSEDWGFYDHKGYDLNQIRAALEDTMDKGKKLRGASTISQQLTKNLFFDHSKSFIRKAKELASTLYLEKHLSKKKILEVYLNIVEFGEGLYGIHDASIFYFGKPVSKLNAKEGAFLAMLLPSPKRYAQSFRDKSLTDYAKKTIDDILKKMVVAKYLKKSELEKELNRKLIFKGQKKAVKKAIIKPFKRPNKKKLPKLSKEEAIEEGYKVDKELILDEDIEFDEDAIPEDTKGLQEEFSAD